MNMWNICMASMAVTSFVLVPNHSGGWVGSQNRQPASILVLIYIPARESLGKNLLGAVSRRRKTLQPTASRRLTPRLCRSMSGVANEQKDPQDQQAPKQGHTYEHQQVTPTTEIVIVVHHSEASHLSMRAVRTSPPAEHSRILLHDAPLHDAHTESFCSYRQMRQAPPCCRKSVFVEHFCSTFPKRAGAGIFPINTTFQRSTAVVIDDPRSTEKCRP